MTTANRDEKGSPELLLLSIDTNSAPAYPCRPYFGRGFIPVIMQVQGHETHIPTQQTKARSHPRVSSPNGDQSRPPGPEAPSRKRPRPACTVTGFHSAVATVTATTNDNTELRAATIARFSRQNRMLDAASYARVFKKAGRSKDKLFTVLYRRNNLERARLGLAVSKKNCRLAVGRNRIKRIVRESFRKHQGDLAGIDVVVLNQAGTHKADNKALFDSLAGHWRRCRDSNRARQD